MFISRAEAFSGYPQHAMHISILCEAADTLAAELDSHTKLSTDCQ